MSSRKYVIPVHPNSTAARLWGRTDWNSARNPWAEAAFLERAGYHRQAAAIRKRAAKENVTAVHC